MDSHLKTAAGLLKNMNVLNGTIGAIVMTPSTKVLLAHHETEWFPLASAAKVAIGAAIANHVKIGEMDWHSRIEHLLFDSNEDSDRLYPELLNKKAYSLAEVVEVMIACHDHHCAEAIAHFVGGWDSLGRMVSDFVPNVFVNENRRSLTNNMGKLCELAKIVAKVAQGYRVDKSVWKPVLSGLLKQADKIPEIPANRQWNMTGGLPTVVLDAGILGDIQSEKYLIYAVAGKGLADRAKTTDTDQQLERFVLELFHVVTEGDAIFE